jgi:hypothetical protein
MTEFTNCPAAGCQSKVVIWPIEDGIGVNFCCQNCWNWFWADMSGTTGEVPADLPAHSANCVARQAKRADEPLAHIPEDANVFVMGRQHHDAIKALRTGDAPPVPKL